MQARTIVLFALVGCADQDTGSVVHVSGDDTAIGLVVDGKVELEPRFLEGLPNADIEVSPLPLLTSFDIVVPTEDGRWRIGLTTTAGCHDDTCDWRYHTEVWTQDSLFGTVHSWHLLKQSDTCGTKEIASRSLLRQ